MYSREVEKTQSVYIFMAPTASVAPSAMFHISVALLLLLTTLVSSQNQGSKLAISDIRLVDGRDLHEGSIQVSSVVEDGSLSFQYLCDDGFGFSEADLICRDLGFEGAHRFTRNNHFGSTPSTRSRNSIQYFPDRLDCSSTNTSYGDCPIGVPSTHDCLDGEIAGVECRTAESQCLPDEFQCRDSSSCIPRDEVCDGISQCPDNSDDAEELCNDFNIVRVRGNTPINIRGAVLGTVQVKYNGEWGGMCDDKTSEKEAKVVCRQLGYGDGWSVAFMASYLGEVEGEILVYAPGCSGDEQTLGQCPDFEWGRFNRCPEDRENFGVFCFNEGVEVRLDSVSNRHLETISGRVEIRMGGSWGSLCDSGFDIFDAQVICRMLGYVGDAVSHKAYGPAHGPIWDLRLDCIGSEQNIEECRVRIMNSTCRLSHTAGATCSRSKRQVDADLKAALGNADCGIPEDASNQFLTRLAKVRGGTPPSRFDTPWVVSLRSRKEAGGRLLCGGVIISEDFVLTAAHCLEVGGPLNIVIRVGDYNSDFDEDSEEDFYIDKLWVHEDEDEHSFNNNDIALLKIERKYGRGIIFGPRVKPICLPSVRDSYDQLSKCTFVGWGPTFFTNDPESRPREAETDIVSDYTCEGAIGGPGNYTSSMVCVARPRVLACQGDSGGPLTCPVNGRQTLYGLVSTGRRCTFFDAADVYVRITKFVDWILEKVKSSHNRRF